MDNQHHPPSRSGRLPTGGLGTPFQRLWAASTVSTFGDGMYLAALPLLAAELTRDPLAVSVVTFAGWLPWLLFALPAGAMVVRLDRRRVMWVVDASRTLVVGALTVAVLAGWASIPLLAVAGFLVGAGQTLFENAAQAMVAVAVGGIPGSLLAARVGQRVPPGPLIVGGVLVGAVVMACFGLATSPWLVALAYAATGAVWGVWNVTLLSLRQEIVPDRLMGRVVGAIRLIGFGSIPIGALLGGLVARSLGLRAPFLGGAAVLAVAALAAAPVVTTGAIQAARAGPGPGPASPPGPRPGPGPCSDGGRPGTPPRRTRRRRGPRSRPGRC